MLDQGRLAVVVNQSSNSVSLVALGTGTVLDECSVGRRPSAIMLSPAGEPWVTTAHGGEVIRLTCDGLRLAVQARVSIGGEPHGLAFSPDGKTAYVAQVAAAQIAVIDTATMARTGQIPVGRWPRYLAMNPDGDRLAVGLSGEGGIAVVDVATQQVLFRENFLGLNFGHMRASHDGRHVYFPWVVYRNNPITQSNIRLGWVLASRIARVRLDEHHRREALSLDPPGRAVADPFGIDLTPDEQWIVATASGSHELLIYRAEGLPWKDYGGPGDHIDPELLADGERFARVELGGRPLAVRVAADGRRAWVANALLDALQEVDLVERRVVREIRLGGPTEPSLARLGEAIFFDGRRSLDQWYSCHTCHYEGGTNLLTMDTTNDGQFHGTFKTVKPLFDVTRTGPWTWHGWQHDFPAALRKSLDDTMLGPQPTDEDVTALAAYLETLRPAPPSGALDAEGRLTPAAARGQAIFAGEVAGCAQCHRGPYLSDEEVHDVGTGSPGDKYQGFNTPVLIGVAQRARWLHDGRARSLQELLTGPHAPEQVGGQRALTPEERADLIEYLQSL
ncbi:MAG: c-type cytochrome [Pirellulales bacterium]|nr:c-type cytochrome [Pirellulales bacterium]